MVYSLQKNEGGYYKDNEKHKREDSLVSWYSTQQL